MKKKVIIGIVIVIIILVILIVIGTMVFNSAENVYDNMLDMGETGPIEDYSEDYIIGIGTITSFNIEVLDTTLWTKIDKVLVNNEDLVTVNQEILNVSNEDATGKIYSTISGKIFIEDGIMGKTYTIYDLDNLGFELQVPEEYAKNLKIGQKVECNLRATNETLYGRVCYISYIPTNEEITVKVKLDNTEKIKIGYTVNAEILLDSDIDSTTPIYDIKNSIPKIGKTAIIYKNTGEQFDFSSIEELSSNEDLMAEYEAALAEQAQLIEQLTSELEILYGTVDSMQYDVNEPTIDQIEEYYKAQLEEQKGEYEKAIFQLQAKIEELQNRISELEQGSNIENENP